MPPAVGMRFARFELVSLLGAGGMGDVWRARDQDLHRDVAIKFLPERFAADPVRLGRFAQEARAASSLNHPNIVTIHEIGETSGVPYIVMELVEGRTLREVVLGLEGRPLADAAAARDRRADGRRPGQGPRRGHRPPRPQARERDGDGRRLRQGARLRPRQAARRRPPAAQGQGGERGRAVVRLEQPTWPGLSPQHTAVGAVIGTVGYMSPEQARGHAVDFRSDQFTLGAILYELASGQQAFRRETPAQTIASIIEDAPEPLATRNPSLPAPLRWLIERCLAKDPGERYASTLDLARELRGLRERLGEAGGTGSWASAVAVRAAAQARRPAGIAFIAALVAALSLAVPSVRERVAVGLELRPVPKEKGVAVLPFRTTSPDAEDQLRADGLGETLVSRLAQLQRAEPALWIVPASEVRQSGVQSADAARRAFGVTLVVTGNVQRLGDRLRINVSLVDAARQKQLRAVGPRDCRPDDLALQDQVLDDVVRMLELALDSGEQQALHQGGTSVGSAHALYLQARGHLQRYDQKPSVEQAIGLFQQALQQDPGYALAYAGLGEAQWRLYGLTRATAHVELARKASERALQNNDLLAPVHVTLGMIRAGTGEPQAALADFDRALALDPANVDALREKAAAYQALGRQPRTEALYRAPSSCARVLGQPLLPGRLLLPPRPLRGGRGGVPQGDRARAREPARLREPGRGAARGRGPRRRGGARARAQPGAAAELRRGRPTSASIEFSRGRYAAAARAYEKALELETDDYRVWRNLGVSYFWAEGEKAKAPEALARAVALGEKQLEVNPKRRRAARGPRRLPGAARQRRARPRAAEAGARARAGRRRGAAHGGRGVRADRRPRHGAALDPARARLRLSAGRASRTTRARRAAPTRASRVRLQSETFRASPQSELGPHVERDHKEAAWPTASQGLDHPQAQRPGAGAPLTRHPDGGRELHDRQSPTGGTGRRHPRHGSSIQPKSQGIAARAKLSADLQAGAGAGLRRVRRVAQERPLRRGRLEARGDHRPVAAA